MKQELELVYILKVPTIPKLNNLPLERAFLLPWMEEERNMHLYQTDLEGRSRRTLVEAVSF